MESARASGRLERLSARLCPGYRRPAGTEGSRTRNAHEVKEFEEVMEFLEFIAFLDFLRFYQEFDVGV